MEHSFRGDLQLLYPAVSSILPVTFLACRNCPRSAIQAQEQVLDPCCEPYAQPSTSLAFFTGSKKAAHYKVIRWLLSFAVEGSQSSLTSVWTSLASCKKKKNLSRWWTYFGHYIDFDFCGEFTFSWNLWNWFRSWTRDWIRFSSKKLFSRRTWLYSLRYTCSAKYDSFTYSFLK